LFEFVVAEFDCWFCVLLVSAWATAAPIAASSAAAAAVAVNFFWNVRMLISPVVRVVRVLLSVDASGPGFLIQQCGCPLG
jgi:hypothetical protein